jgi:hypothetical protein
MLRLIAARLVGGLISALLRPFLRLGLLVLGVAAAVELPARLWLMYGDADTSVSILAMIRWVAGGILALSWLGLRIAPLRRCSGRSS